MIAVYLLVSATVCWGLGFPVYQWLAARKIIDKPNERSSHSRPTARGGGIAIMVTILLGAAGISVATGEGMPLAFLGAGLLISGVSFWDDLRSLPVQVRFGCHAVAAAALLVLIAWEHPRLALAAGHGVEVNRFLAGAVIFLWITGYTNAFNFMDGINGLAGFQAALTGTGMALLAGKASGEWTAAPVLLGAVIGGAGTGFLPHNFPKARMFMGDVGSAPLGFLLAGLAFWMAAELGWWLLIPLMLMHANFILDTGITLLRRVARGEKWHQPHREHFYQRLIRGGKSHAVVTGWEAGLQVITLGILLLYVGSDLPVRLACLGAVIGVWLAFFGWSERVFRAQSPAAPAAGPRSTPAPKPME